MPSLEYLITCLVVVLIRRGVIYTVSTALVHGRRAGIPAALACTLGILPHLLATILGVAAIPHSSALVFETLRYAGAAYLLYLAYATSARSFRAGGGRRWCDTRHSIAGCQGATGQSAEPEADHLFPGLPAAVRPARRR